MKITPKLFEKFRRIDGSVFTGLLPSASEGGQSVTPSFRVLYVKKPTFVKTGDVVKSHGGEFLILMEFPDDSEDLAAFKVAYASKIFTWDRQTTVLHPVSKAPMGTDWVDQGRLYVNFDMPTEAPVGTLTDTRYRFITGQDVRLNDRVAGNKYVKTIYEVLGVKLCYCE